MSDPALARGKPPWFKVRVGAGAAYGTLEGTLRRLELKTVCEEAHCPNRGECWGSGTATFLLLGPTCTRACRFCRVESGKPAKPRREEPEQVAEAARVLGLDYVVLTMVDRDDLEDGGAEHVARSVSLIKTLGIAVEALVGDFGGRTEPIATVLSAGPDVFGHNLEVTRSLQPAMRDRRSSYDQSLLVLRHAKSLGGARFTKSSLMLGLGETRGEVLAALKDLRAASVDIVTLGQYACPSPGHAKVARWVPPAEFEELGRTAEEFGFAFVAAGPLVRSSYHAAEGFVRAALSQDRGVSDRPGG
jgi:lipoic acid synthetase